MQAQPITRDPHVIARLNGTLARCRSLVFEQREVVRTRTRSNWLAAGIAPLHSTDPPASEELSARGALAHSAEQALRD
ncbi:MAG TPA: hypothetical protein VGJ77_13885 [Gaiellaceae bacterium]